MKLLRPSSPESHYETLRHLYQGCQVVQGNLELTYLPADADTSFLKVRSGKTPRGGEGRGSGRLLTRVPPMAGHQGGAGVRADRGEPSERAGAAEPAHHPRHAALPGALRPGRVGQRRPRRGTGAAPARHEAPHRWGSPVWGRHGVLGYVGCCSCSWELPAPVWGGSLSLFWVPTLDWVLPRSPQGLQVHGDPPTCPLTEILKGGVLIERNPELCFQETILWSDILHRHNEFRADIQVEATRTRSCE